MVDQVLE